MPSDTSEMLHILANNLTEIVIMQAAAATGGNVTTGGGTTAAAKNKKPKHYIFMARDSWYTIAGVIGFFMILNVFTRGIAYWERRRYANKVSEFGKEGRASHETPHISRVPQAGSTVIQNLGLCSTLPAWLGGATFGELFFHVGYSAALAIFAFHETVPDTPGGWGNQAGHMAFAQIPLIIGLAQKNNVISCLTGIGYEKLNYLHRTAGRATLFLSWIHVLGRSLKGYHGGFVEELKEENYLRWGLVAIIFFTLLTFGSFRTLRNRAYELFLVSHIVMVIGYLVGCWLHWDKFSYWIYPGFVIWGFDRLVRLLRLVLLNKLWMFPSRRAQQGITDTKVEVLGSDVLRVTIKRDGLRWAPGQHAYVIMPTVSRLPFEAHPFTIANMPGSNDGNAVFIVRARDGFTKRLMAKAEGDVAIPAFVEGPYGHGCSLNSFEQVLLVCGGSGITFGTSNLIDIINKAQSGSSAVRRVKLVWMIRDRAHWKWIQNLLLPVLENLPTSLVVEIDLYVTTRTPVEPNLTAEEEAEEAAVPLNLYENNSADSSTITNLQSEKDEKAFTRPGSRRSSSTTDDSVVTWHVGRADLETVLSTMVKEASRSVSVNVCGPRTLQQATSDAVKNVGSAMNVIQGQQPITYYSETFGW